ncbi:phage/plasmid primase, P4 family [uncultured Clostridium sp.]|uniref:DNA primase family protein n=1 Tax=uncultured Clostridium sp. TaxID=59620 RepID=UPI0028EF730B|nr:phage/plasmid primase, P4 family [uncultured Clostridium sp.]
MQTNKLPDKQLKEVKLKRIGNNKKKFKKEDKFLMKNNRKKSLIVMEYVKYVLDKNKIICINEILYKYNKKLGFYEQIARHDCEVLIFDCIEKEHYIYITKREIELIYNTIKVFPKIQIDKKLINKMEIINTRYINYKDGVIDIKNKKTIEHDSELYLFNCINANLKENFEEIKFKDTKFYKFITDITNGDKQLINLLREIMGYTFSNLNNAKKFFIFEGYSNTGKSVLLDLIEFIIGSINVSHIPLQKLNESKYVAQLQNKLLNVCSELPDEGIKDLGMIKNIVSPNDTITARPIYGSPISFKNKAKLIFATNSMPELNVKLYKDTEAFFNRVIIIPFLNVIPNKIQDKELYEKLKKEKNYIFTWAINGLLKYVKNGYRFSECKISEKCLEKYKASENIIERFIMEKIEFDECEYVFTDNLKKEFIDFAKENGHAHINNKEFNFLKEFIKERFSIKYTKIHRNNNNKWGFKGIYIK